MGLLYGRGPLCVLLYGIVSRLRSYTVPFLKRSINKVCCFLLLQGLFVRKLFSPSMALCVLCVILLSVSHGSHDGGSTV